MLPAQLRIRHVQPHPTPVEYPLVDPVADTQPTFDHPGDSREPEQLNPWVAPVIDHVPAAPDAFVQLQESAQVRFAAQYPLPHKNQVVVSVLCPVRQE